MQEHILRLLTRTQNLIFSIYVKVFDHFSFTINEVGQSYELCSNLRVMNNKNNLIRKII